MEELGLTDRIYLHIQFELQYREVSMGNMAVKLYTKGDGISKQLLQISTRYEMSPDHYNNFIRQLYNCNGICYTCTIFL